MVLLGLMARTPQVTGMPSIPGIFTSSSTTSGRTCGTSASASSPHATSPTTCMSGLQTQASSAAATKLMLNLQQQMEKKKETGRCPGETRPVYPDKGCVGEVLGSEYFLP